MEELEIKRKLIAVATLRDVQEIDNEDIKRLSQYITINEAKDGNIYYWYLDCDGIEEVADINGNIVKIDDTMDFFGIVPF